MNAISDYEKALRLGKQWMRRSFDPTHNFEHAQTVERTMLDVFDDYVGTHPQENVGNLKKLCRLAAWWHDCFKATIKTPTIHQMLIEGPESEKIIRKTISHLLTQADLEALCTAVRNHAGLREVGRYFLFGRARSQLHRILLESDGIDVFNIDRFQRGYIKPGHTAKRVWAYIDLISAIMVPFYIRSPLLRNRLKPVRRKYLAMWFWKEWYLFRILFIRWHTAGPTYLPDSPASRNILR